jgi:hypothetical protein
MRPTPNRHAAIRPVHHVLATLNQPAQIAKLARAVGVRKHGVLAPDVSQAVRHGAALAAVPRQPDHPEDVVEVVFAGKVERDLDRAVAAAVVNDEDLIARRLRRALRSGWSGGGRVRAEDEAVRGCCAFAFLGGGGCCGSVLSLLLRVEELVAVVVGTTELLVEVLNHFFESRSQARFLVVGRDDDADFDFGGLDDGFTDQGEAFGDGGIFLGEGTLGTPAVVPAWEGPWGGDGAVGIGGDVGLFGGEREARDGGEQVEGDEDLGG